MSQGPGTTGALVVVRGGDTIHKRRGARIKTSDELGREKLRVHV